MTYEDLKVLADIVNDEYSYYKQHGKGEETETIKKITTEFVRNAEGFESDKKDGLKLFNF